MEQCIHSSLCTGIREGLTATRIAELLNAKLHELGQENSQPGALICIDTGEQCTISGAGAIFEEFKRSGKLINYIEYVTNPMSFYDANYGTSACRYMKFDETFWKIPYDVCSHNTLTN